MSYILHFQSRPGSKPTTVQEVKNHFLDRQFYEVNDYQALYSNEDNGIFFTFEYGGARDSRQDPQGNILPAYFNLSFARPHTFALEAEPELSDFIKSLDLLVSDPYMKGSGYVEYNELDFYKGWNSGNAAHYKNLLQNNHGQELLTLPSSLLEKCWRWNYHLKHLQGELGQEMFIPKILFIQYQGRLLTSVVWTDAIPIALPKVDSIILYRKTLAQRTFIRKSEDMVLVMREEVEPLLSDFPVSEEHFSYYTVIYRDPTPEIKSFFQMQKPAKTEIKFIPPDQIHDQELLETVRSTASLR